MWSYFEFNRPKVKKQNADYWRDHDPTVLIISQVIKIPSNEVMFHMQFVQKK